MALKICSQIFSEESPDSRKQGVPTISGFPTQNVGTRKCHRDEPGDAGVKRPSYWVSA